MLCLASQRFPKWFKATGKRKQLGRQARTHVQATKGGRSDCRVAVHGGSGSLLEKDTIVGECPFTVRDG